MGWSTNEKYFAYEVERKRREINKKLASSKRQRRGTIKMKTKNGKTLKPKKSLMPTYFSIQLAGERREARTRACQKKIIEVACGKGRTVALENQYVINNLDKKKEKFAEKKLTQAEIA